MSLILTLAKISPIPYPKKQKPGTRNLKPETRNQKPETRNLKPETWNQKPETLLFIRSTTSPGGVRRVTA